ncbi:Hypothetical predicted protein [Olea europaea subsp. europaea]|uniref:Uncharacterized protein n=1 Tax=Olea europaea subsp. europaea TaxID=158383 RepID=A0A8S0PND7_OLEEU|nr:Hypothetical predicted protein [Olea europaea subsp. europaea]
MKSISLLHDSKLKSGVESSLLESHVPTLDGLAAVEFFKQSNFQAILGNFWAWCASNVWDASSPHILGSFGDTVRRPNSGQVMATEGTQPDFQAFFYSFWALCAGHVRDDASEPWQGRSLIFRHFKAVFWQGAQTMFGTRHDRGNVRDALGCGRDATRFPGIFGQFLGHSVQATYTTRQGRNPIFKHFSTVSGRQCASHKWDISGWWQGRSLIFRHFWEVFGHGVLATSGACLIAVGTPPNFSTFVGIHPDFQAFLGNFWDSMCKPCPGRVMATVGMEPNFQVILGSFMDTVCKPCPRCGRDASRLSSIFRRFLEHDVQAMFGTRLVHDRDAAWFSGSFRDTVCKSCPGCCKDTP